MKIILTTLASLALSSAYAQSLPSEETVRNQIRTSAQSMSCMQIAQVIATDTIPSAAAIIKTPDSKSIEERNLFAAILIEIADQLKLKCVQ